MCHTGHCFRGTSRTLLVDADVDILALKQHRGQKSTNLAEGCVEQSYVQKKNSDQNIGDILEPELDNNQLSISTSYHNDNVLDKNILNAKAPTPYTNINFFQWCQHWINNHYK